MSENALNIAVAQVPVSEKPEENLDVAIRHAREAAGRGADLLVFPEMFMARPEEGKTLADVAEPLDGAFVLGLANLAKEHQMAIISGIWETVPGEKEKAANVSVVIGADGEILARYHKIHLFDALSVRESVRMTGGDKLPPVFAIKGMNIGIAICYDLRFPELFRSLANRGADAVIVPAAWYAGPLKEEHWLTLLRSRAIENTIYVAGAGLCGPPFAGRSAIFDPFGVALADAGEAEFLLTARLERQRIDEVRAKLPVLGHIRRDIFGG